jgi:hypothetical protein
VYGISRSFAAMARDARLSHDVLIEEPGTRGEILCQYS